MADEPVSAPPPAGPEASLALTEPDAIPPAPPPPPPAGPRPVARPRQHPVFRLIGPLTTGLLCLALVTLLVGQLAQANEVLRSELAARDAQHAADQSQVSLLQAQIQDLKERWFGNPALYQPPAIANTTIEHFTVTGTTQQRIMESFAAADLCKTHGPCTPDPAVPNGTVLGLEWFAPAVSSYICTSARTTSVLYREFVLLPQWLPPADGTVKIPLVERWNALAQAIYVHEAGHAAIDRQDIADLNAAAQRLPTCDALASFWDNPHVFDKNVADQAAYHARLHADCRPEIGCIPAGWQGW